MNKRQRKKAWKKDMGLSKQEWAQFRQLTRDISRDLMDAFETAGMIGKEIRANIEQLTDVAVKVLEKWEREHIRDFHSLARELEAMMTRKEATHSTPPPAMH